MDAADWALDGLGQGMVTGVSSTQAAGTYGAGTVIPITVTFSEPVTVDTTGGTPALALNSKGTNASATATYNSISADGLTLTFNYTVAAGDATSDLDYTSTTALASTVAPSWIRLCRSPPL